MSSEVCAPVDTDSLARLFRPGSVALVGATEQSGWSNAAWQNLERFGFSGRIDLVNRRGGDVYGRPAATSCAMLAEAPDVALLMLPAHAILAALNDLGSAGGRNAIILTSGFAETGADGAAVQSAIAERARSHGIRLVGPNCLGFINYTDRVPVWTTPLAAPVHTPRGLGIVSQSGAVAGMIRTFAQQQAIQPSYVISTGNEVDLTVADAIAHLAIDPATRAIALFIEGVRDPDRFAAAARTARAAGKPIVALKIGRSEASARAAQAHTGALIGDDRIFDAVCLDLGIVRVSSMEELVITADLMTTTRPIAGNRIGFVSMSGGVCEIASDRADAEGLVAVPLADATTAALEEALPSFAHPQNPLDITGGAMTEPHLFEAALTILRDDPGLDMLVCFFDAPGAVQSHAFISRVLDHLSRGLRDSPIPALLVSHTLAPVSPEARALLDETGVGFVSGGIQLGIAALGRAARWTPCAGSGGSPLPAPSHAAPVSGERAVLDHLARHGVPVIPASLARNADEAAAAAEQFGRATALKIASPDIAHKSDVGGVLLNVADAGTARAAFETIVQRVAKAAPDARLDGVLVSPMRNTGGIELIVGIVRDPVWGLAVTVGLGGVLTEMLDDVATRLLPIDENGALAMLASLRGSALLDGFRGSPAIDRAAVARAIVGIGTAARALGDELEALEVNPLLANSDGAEALDALAIYAR